MTKPVVQYIAKKGIIQVGMGATIRPIDHPDPHGLVSNTTMIITSKVIRVNQKTKEFETENTIYVPAPT